MNGANDNVRKPFIDHVNELRFRLFWVVCTVIIAGSGAFAVHEYLLEIIQRPLHETLYFTSPTGGLSFIFQLCLTAGLVVAFPVIAYHTYKFLSPLLIEKSRLTIFAYIVGSFLMACLGIAFAYFISLPAALNFLTQFGEGSIQSLIKADEYFSFALAYIGGFAIMFQIPLLILLVNRITPLKPSKMIKSQRWVILLSFIGAAIITPTPDPINQALMAAPAILLFQISIVLVAILNRGRKPAATPSPRLAVVPQERPQKQTSVKRPAVRSMDGILRPSP